MRGQNFMPSIRAGALIKILFLLLESKEGENFQRSFLLLNASSIPRSARLCRILVACLRLSSHIDIWPCYSWQFSIRTSFFTELTTSGTDLAYLITVLFMILIIFFLFFPRSMSNRKATIVLLLICILLSLLSLVLSSRWTSSSESSLTTLTGWKNR